MIDFNHFKILIKCVRVTTKYLLTESTLCVIMLQLLLSYSIFYLQIRGIKNALFIWFTELVS